MIVVDASVAVKWFVAEAEHDIAMSLLAPSETLAAPDFVVLETLNVLKRKLKKREMRSEQATAAIDALPGFFDLLIPSADLSRQTFDLSLRLDHPVYDCAYLACAQALGAVLMTADAVFANKASQAGFADVVRTLSMGLPPSPIFGASDLDIVVARCIALHAAFDRTMRFVFSLVRSTDEGSRFVRMTDLRPAFDSPTHVGLRRFVASLDRSTRAHLMALGWLGQGNVGEDWAAIVKRAGDYLTDDARIHLDYLLSLFGYLEAGRAKQPSIASLHSPTDPSPES